MVSVVDKIGNEAHLFANGSRTVVRTSPTNFLSASEFYDQAGLGVHVPVPSKELASVLFDNKHLTPQNLRLYSKINNSLWTGHKPSLERMPNLMEKAFRF
jgi:hypothetical protein